MTPREDSDAASSAAPAVRLPEQMLASPPLQSAIPMEVGAPSEPVTPLELLPPPKAPLMWPAPSDVLPMLSLSFPPLVTMAHLLPLENVF